jgi:hypothetical protein
MLVVLTNTTTQHPELLGGFKQYGMRCDASAVY